MGENLSTACSSSVSSFLDKLRTSGILPLAGLLGFSLTSWSPSWYLGQLSSFSLSLPSLVGLAGSLSLVGRGAVAISASSSSSVSSSSSSVRVSRSLLALGF